MLRARETVFPREEHINWLANNKMAHTGNIIQNYTHYTLCLDIYAYTYSSMHVTTINAKGHEFEIDKEVLRENLEGEKGK